MKESNLSLSTFMDRFTEMDRRENFSYDGLKALYDYIEQYEEDCGQSVELDVVALCCEYSEYEDLEEYLKDYGNCHQTFKEFKEDNKELYDSDEEFDDEFKDMIMQELQDKTQLIEISGKDSFIIQCY